MSRVDSSRFVSVKRLVPLLALALLATACSAFGAAPAATVERTEITTKSLDGELAAIRGNEAYQSVLEQTYGAPAEGPGGKGTFDAAFVAQILSLRVWYQAIENDLDERGLLPVPDDLVRAAEGAMAQQFAQLDPAAFDEFPDDYRDQLVQQRAMVMLIEREIAEEIGDDPEAFYDENPDEFTEICVSHVLVGVQGGRTAGEAQTAALGLRDRIEDGEDFETIAREESDDPAAAADGGALGCGSRLSLQFDPTFEAAAFALEEGEVSDPVQTRFGSHLILVTDKRQQDFDEIEDSIPQVMAQARIQRVDDYLVDIICGEDVSVNPRYGTWTEETCESTSPRIPHVEPPEGPRSTEPEGEQFQL